MQFSHSIIYVSDVPKSLNFYSQAFDLKIKFIHETQAYGELDTGLTALSFANHQLAEFNFSETKFKKLTLSNIEQNPLSCEIGLETEKVEYYYQKAQELGAHPILPPSVKPWGQTVAYLRDLDGYLIALGNSARG